MTWRGIDAPQAAAPIETEAQYWTRIFEESIARTEAAGLPLVDNFEIWLRETRGQKHVHFRHEFGVRSTSLRHPDPKPQYPERYPFYRRIIPWGCVDCFFTFHRFVENEIAWKRIREQAQLRQKKPAKGSNVHPMRLHG